MRKALVLVAVALTAAPASSQQFGQWRLVMDQDPITDANRSRVFTRALNASLLSDPGLYFQCSGDVAGVYIDADDFLNSDGRIQVQWRFDRSPAQEGRWSVSPRGVGAWLPPVRVKDFAAGARQGSRLFVRAFDYRGVPHDMEFSLSGAATALDRLPCSLPPSAEEEAAAAAVAAERERAELQEERAAADERFRARVYAAAGSDDVRFIGNPDFKDYAPLWDEGCRRWAAYWSLEEAVFFETEEEAEAAGYRLWSRC